MKTAVLVTEGSAVVTTYALTAGAKVTAAAIGGFAAGAVSSGSLKGAMQGALSGAVFAGVGSIVGDAGLTASGSVYDPGAFVGAVALHGVAGCVTSVMGGGKCGPGALSAAFSKGALPLTTGVPDGLPRAMAHAVVGGTAAEIGGGKFANGAQTGAFSYLYNYCASLGCIREMADSFGRRVDSAIQSLAKAGRELAWALTPGTAAIDCLQQGCGVLGAAAAAADFVPGGKVATLTFKSAHYAQRLTSAGLDTARVEAAVAADIAKIPSNSLAVGGDFGNRIVVDNVPVIYRAQPQPSGTINIGTIHPDDGRWMQKKGP